MQVSLSVLFFSTYAITDKYVRV